ncbi:HD domain-containing protein [Cryomorpha ignava]|uniref:HD domain-containing protein n=1 Tax=Cryomorpha ignava TaxID=101383 RepID=A0A7K3WQY3_9FLAO|nr:HD domain-containing protein [Cryomorpha ignava]NEN24087.1 HD domain-containing protein [Cryomorpha ignava]
MGEINLFEPFNKRKILNDPVYGFITMPNELIYDLVEHPYFQRLRRIKQVGMSHLVYPGANHTRFHHALGATHLMQTAITNLREKGIEISEEEARGALVAILLHDIGHGPFSHSLEFTVVKNVSHEVISALLMERLNKEFKGALTTGIKIFKGEYPKPFLHQLVSSQLDMDRLDYLSRDSFYTGVSEGVVSNQRIIKMLNVYDNNLVVEEKGIYSIEKFIVARRLMYWQVYLHKTVVSAERLLINILTRAKFCARRGDKLFGSPPLCYFLYHDYGREDFVNDPEVIDTFVKLDDIDIMGAIKVWTNHEDKILSDLCTKLTDRRLPSVILSKSPFDESEINKLKQKTMDLLHLNTEEVKYYFHLDVLENHAYDSAIDGINILTKTGNLIDLAEASDNRTLLAQTEAVKKYVLYFPKEVKKNA